MTLHYICFVSISVEGTYWSAIVLNKDQLTHPACVQFMGEIQQGVFNNQKPAPNLHMFKYTLEKENGVLY